ncbi:hypothetical protein [Vibrio salinus]|uniref:hypothetical protein n=1 Tax=Vibrio salinus TaxID=2899784 RepID=UPI001E59185B|nr:hypothetical protein [Vibrio salinus]MCE0493113.1 hypothetical protein [Vibrio salinus]
MKKERKIKSLAVKEIDYELDSYRRARFIKNNKAALIHGGYSRDMPPEVKDAFLANDYSYEFAQLKNQVAQIAILGGSRIEELYEQGDVSSALAVSLACADRVSKLIPQIQKALESPLLADDELPPAKQKIKNRWLKKLQTGGCTALDVAYQFEVNDLGSLPTYVLKKLDFELKNTTVEIEDELFTRQDIDKMTEEYWNNIESERTKQEDRLKAIHLEKARINKKFFGDNEESDK